MPQQITLNIHGAARTSWPRDMVASFVVSDLGRDPSEFALQREDGTLVGSASPLGDVLRDGDQLELARIRS